MNLILGTLQVIITLLFAGMSKDAYDKEGKFSPVVIVAIFFFAISLATSAYLFAM